jgi:hypothetical protein
MSQDHTLITVLGEPDAAIWHKKLAAIRELGAMACMNAHPDEGYIGDADKVDRYGDFLQGLSGDQTIWNPHPAELAEWWRARREVGLIAEATGVSLSADDERMCLRWARLEDQQLVFDETSKRWPA